MFKIRVRKKTPHRAINEAAQKSRVVKAADNQSTIALNGSNHKKNRYSC